MPGRFNIDMLAAELPNFGANDYFTIPREIRDLAEARRSAAIAAQVDERNGRTRATNFLANQPEILPFTAQLLKADARDVATGEPGAFQRFDQTRQAFRGAEGMGQVAEEYDTYGTANPAEVAALEGLGIYRPKAEQNRMLQYDPGALMAELQRQQQQMSRTGPSPDAPDAPGSSGRGSFSVVPGGADYAKQGRLADLETLLGITGERMAHRRGAGGVDKTALTNQMQAQFTLEAEKRAREVGVDQTLQELLEAAAQNPGFARVAPGVINDLRRRRMTLTNPKAQEYLAPDMRGFTGGYLPGDQQTLDAFQQYLAEQEAQAAEQEQEQAAGGGLGGLWRYLFGGGGGGQTAPSPNPRPSRMR